MGYAEKFVVKSVEDWKSSLWNACGNAGRKIWRTFFVPISMSSPLMAWLTGLSTRSSMTKADIYRIIEDVNKPPVDIGLVGEDIGSIIVDIIYFFREVGGWKMVR